jgi:hypothetical protein
VRISRGGHGAVVLASEDEWQRRTRPRRSLTDLLTNCPIEPGDVPERMPDPHFGDAFTR